MQHSSPLAGIRIYHFVLYAVDQKLKKLRIRRELEARGIRVVYVSCQGIHLEWKSLPLQLSRTEKKEDKRVNLTNKSISNQT